MSKDSIYRFLTNLIDLANYLETGGQSRLMSGARTGLTAKEGARALMIKIVKTLNKISQETKA